MSIKDTLDNALSDQERVDGLIKLAQLNKTQKELRATVKYLTAEVQQLQSEIALSLSTVDAAPIKTRKLAKDKSGYSTPVLMWSDHHIEEIVPLEQTNNRNEYNPEIAERRFDVLVNRSCDLIRHESRRSKIGDAVVWLGGDFMSGFIHDDLIEVCATPPLLTAEIVMKRLLGALQFIADKTKIDSIYVPTSYGNHGRISSGKPRIATAADHNLEHMVYRTLARELQSDSRFVFDVQRTRLKILDLEGYRIRFSHGDDLKYSGGNAGFHGPVMNQVRKWNQETPVDLDVMGHYHTFADLPGLAVMNGSLIGHSEYSKKFGYSHPLQVLFFVDRERNDKSSTHPIWVD